MHPAQSVIFFTTTSGAGYGLLIWLALLAPFRTLPNDTAFTIVTFAIGVGLVIAGLLASTFHLGHPERAWRAMSQWRTSWLSREGLAAVATFVPALLWGLSVLSNGFETSVSILLGLVTAGLSLVTVYCTGMIYASLKTIPAWHNNWTRLAYPLLSLTTGAMLAIVLLVLFSVREIDTLVELTILLFVNGGALKYVYWRSIDNAAPTSTAETATGLGALGKVRLLEKPHSGTNYLMREMGFQIARKHASKLRRLCLVFGFAIPAVLLLLVLIVPAAMPFLALVALLSAGVGIVMERWLFFAEAKHVVTLYYGESAV